MTAIHTRVSTEYLPTWSILTAAGSATGPESASRWLNCVQAILHCWRPICTIASDIETPPLVHIAMLLMRRQNMMVLHCPAHDQAQWESWPNLDYQSDPRRLWSFLERISAVTRPPTGNERQRELQTEAGIPL